MHTAGSVKYELNVCVFTEYDYHHEGPSSMLGQYMLDLWQT